MNKKEVKKSLKVYFTTLLLFILMSALTVYFFDPFFVYHAPIGKLKEVQKIHQYQVPGLLRNCDYDGVLLGSSTVMSINSNKLAEKYRCRKVVKAVGNSAPASTLRYYLNLSLETHRVRYVFYGMDVFSFHSSPDTNPLPEEVDYIVNNNPFDDIEYLLNGDVLAENIPIMIKNSLDKNYDPGEAYNFNQWLVSGPDSVLNGYNPQGIKAVSSRGELRQFKNVESNIQALNEIIENNPETKFIFLTPCYSVLWWIRAYNIGMLDAYYHTLDYAYSVLLQNDNAEIYAVNFNNKEYITDLSKFVDLVHGSPETTEMMLNELGNPEQQITKDNYKEHIEKLVEAVDETYERIQTEGTGFFYGNGELDN